MGISIESHRRRLKCSALYRECRGADDHWHSILEWAWIGFTREAQPDRD
jgi:hypothetical protein